MPKIGTRLIPSPATALWCCSVLVIGVAAVGAQTVPAERADDVTLVVGTRFIAPSDDEGSPRDQFADARIPLSAFNDTDHCIDQRALELAMNYFDNLGRTLHKAGHYYFVPGTELEKSAKSCETLHGHPPQAWAGKETKVIAFGKIVPTSEAPALERSIR